MLKQFIEEFRTSLIIPLFILFYIFYCVVEDCPPIFPLKNQEIPLDCYNIHFHSLNQEDSKIWLSFDLSEFIDYPYKASSALIRTNISSKHVKLTYSDFEYSPIIVNESFLKYGIHIDYPGNYNLSLFCNKDQFYSSNITIREAVGKKIGATTIESKRWTLASFKKVILFNNTLTILTNRDIKFNNWEISPNNTLRIFTKPIIKGKAKLNITQNHVIAVPAFSSVHKNNITRQIIDYVIPILLLKQNRSELCFIGDSVQDLFDFKTYTTPKNLTYMFELDVLQTIGGNYFLNDGKVSEKDQINDILNLPLDTFDFNKWLSSGNENETDCIVDEEIADKYSNHNKTCLILKKEQNIKTQLKAISSANTVISANPWLTLFMKSGSNFIDYSLSNVSRFRPIWKANNIKQIQAN